MLQRAPGTRRHGGSNGSGELTGLLQIGDWGCIETPVDPTSTHAVGRVYDGAVAVAVEVEPRVGTEDFVTSLSPPSPPSN